MTVVFDRLGAPVCLASEHTRASRVGHVPSHTSPSTPTPMHLWKINSGDGWSAICILILSCVFIYTATRPPCAKPAPARQPLAVMEKRQPQPRAAPKELVKPKDATFPFRNLPPELQLAVLSHCAHSTRTYRALVLVSRYFLYSTLRACIPVIPITLLTSPALSSFLSFLQRTIHVPHSRSLTFVGSLVTHLWLTPITESPTDTDAARTILSACTNVRVLAVDAHTLTYALGFASHHRHTRCTHLTLLMSPRGWHAALAVTPKGPVFLRQLTHLRVMGHQLVPSRTVTPLFTNLAHLSYVQHFRGISPTCETGPEKPQPVVDSVLFPALQETLVTRRCDPDRRVPPQRLAHNLVLLHVPRDMTEMEIWRKGKSIWHQASQLAHKS